MIGGGWICSTLPLSSSSLGGPMLMDVDFGSWIVCVCEDSLQPCLMSALVEGTPCILMLAHFVPSPRQYLPHHSTASHQTLTPAVEITAEIRSIGLPTLPFCVERSRFMIPCPSPIYRPLRPLPRLYARPTRGNQCFPTRPCFLKLPRQSAVPVRVIPSIPFPNAPPPPPSVPAQQKAKNKTNDMLARSLYFPARCVFGVLRGENMMRGNSNAMPSHEKCRHLYKEEPRTPSRFVWFR